MTVDTTGGQERGADAEERAALEEAKLAQIDFRLERIEQALLVFAGESASQPTHAASELRRILQLPQDGFTDAALLTSGP